MTGGTEPSNISVMGFDFGTHKIGIAVGQTLTQSASPLPEIKAREGQPNWDELKRIIEQWQPEAFVVGIPVMMDGQEFEMTAKARKFAQRLHGRFGKPWFAADERLTSFEARELAHNQGHKKGTLVDSLAASLILQSWLTEQWPTIKDAK